MAVLLKFFGTKIVATLLGGWFLFGQSDKSPSLTEPVLAIQDGRITVSVRVENGFNEEIIQLILTGTPVTLRFEVIVTEDNRVTWEEVIKHRVVYNPGTKVFSVEFTEKNKAETEDEPSMKKLMSEITYLQVMEKFSLEKNYEVSVKVKLEPISVEAAGGEEFDLMTFWNFKTPEAKSGNFKGSQIGKVK